MEKFTQSLIQRVLKVGLDLQKNDVFSKLCQLFDFFKVTAHLMGPQEKC